MPVKTALFSIKFARFRAIMNFRPCSKCCGLFDFHINIIRHVGGDIGAEFDGAAVATAAVVAKNRKLIAVEGYLLSVDRLYRNQFDTGFGDIVVGRFGEVFYTSDGDCAGADGDFVFGHNVHFYFENDGFANRSLGCFDFFIAFQQDGGAGVEGYFFAEKRMGDGCCKSGE